MSKLLHVKNLKIVSNHGKQNEQIIRFDYCEDLKAVKLYRDLDLLEDEKDYDVFMYFVHGRFVASFDKFEDANRLMNDLVAFLQNKEADFLEVDLLNYETK